MVAPLEHVSGSLEYSKRLCQIDDEGHFELLGEGHFDDRGHFLFTTTNSFMLLFTTTALFGTRDTLNFFSRRGTL